MSRRLGPVLAMLGLLAAAAACEDDPTDLDYLKAGAGGNAAAGKSGGGGSSGSAGKAGAPSDADAG